MAVAKVYSAQNNIGSSSLIEVESDLSRGLFSFAIVGLPGKAVEEAKDRVSAAIKNTGFESPKSHNRKVVISLAPADIKKEGPAFDLGIALSYLLSSGDIAFDPAKKMFLGELSLNGEVRTTKGVLPAAILAKKLGFSELYVPKENVEEAGLVDGLSIFAVSTLKEIVEHLDTKPNEKNKSGEVPVIKKIDPFVPKILPDENEEATDHDLKDIQGQFLGKRALEISAAGGHNVLFFGPPGTGKTMLAKSLTSILPKLSEERMLETTSIHSVAGTLKSAFISTPPFRAPHHTSSHVAIVGGGASVRPGEITLAHNGVLFLDEFPEFDRRVIESLREPLEEGSITISRAKGTELFPARITLIAAMNPCPCGNFGGRKECTCSAQSIGRYQRKISGPILDRIDLVVPVEEIKAKELSGKQTGASSKEIRTKIEKARQFQKARQEKLGFNFGQNKDIPSKHIREASLIEDSAFSLLADSSEKLNLSPRAFHRMIRVARTIADLEFSDTVKSSHILEALQFRGKINQ